jgi:hypothetical protein
MHSLVDIAFFQKWATARSCAAKTDAWQVFALHNLAVAIETTSTLTILPVVVAGQIKWPVICQAILPQ